MAGNGFSAWRDRIAWGCVAALVTGGVSWAAWFTVRSFSQPTKPEVIEMIQSYAPYLQDRALIRRQIDQSDRTNERLLVVIEKNTEAINGLKVEMGILRSAFRSEPQ